MLRVDEAIAARRSIRDFRPDPVDLAVVLKILEQASRAPSGSNLQPWRVHVVVASQHARLLAAVRERMETAPFGGPPDHVIHPETFSPAEERRYKRAAALVYDAAGIDRDDKAARAEHLARNWAFFGAPVGLMFTIDRRMQPGQWADVGMYMQNVMLLALQHGLASCAQEAWALMGSVVRETLGLDASEIVYCGMALGYPRGDARINGVRSERMKLEEFVVVHK